MIHSHSCKSFPDANFYLFFGFKKVIDLERNAKKKKRREEN